MTTPRPRSAIDGTSARSRRTAGMRLRSSSLRQCSSIKATKPPAGAEEPPSMCTRMSISPKRSRAERAKSAQPSAVVRSDATKVSSGRSAGR